MAESLLFIIGKRGLEHRAAVILDLIDELIRGHFPDEKEQGGVAGVKACSKLLHEVVVDAEIRQSAAKRAACRANRRAKDGIEE